MTVQFLSAPGVIEPDVRDPSGQAQEIADELGVEVYHPITASELPLAVFEVIRGDPESPSGRELYSEVLFSPVVVVEESFPVVRALGTIVAAEESHAYLVQGHGSAGILVLAWASLFVFWYVGGPIERTRDAAGEAAHKVAGPFFEHLFQEWVETLQQRRRDRRDKDREN